MKITITIICFILSLPFIVAGFGWHFVAYAFGKGKEVCETFFNYLE